MLKPTTLAQGPVYPAAANRDASILAWSNRNGSNRDITLLKNGEALQLTSDPEPDMEPTLTPEGDILIWSRKSGADWDLFQYSHGQVTPFIQEPGDQRKPQISGDGSTLVFEDNGGVGLMREGHRELLAPASGTEISRRPKVSNDGHRVFWERYDESSRSSSLWMRDENQRTKRLFRPEDNWRSYDISRNGRQLTYTVANEKGEDLWVWDLDQGTRRPLANKDDVNETFPSVSPDGTKSYYTLSDFRNYPKVNAYIFADLDGHKKELVSADPKGRDLFPQVSQNGNYLHWIWIDDEDPNNRKLMGAELG